MSAKDVDPRSWPIMQFKADRQDLIVAAIMAGLFLSSAYQIMRQAMAERRAIGARE